MTMFIANADLKIGGAQDYSVDAEISFTGGQLNRVLADYLKTVLTGIKVSF